MEIGTGEEGGFHDQKKGSSVAICGELRSTSVATKLLGSPLLVGPSTDDSGRLRREAFRVV